MKHPIFIFCVIACVTILSFLAVSNGRCQSARQDSSLTPVPALAETPQSNFSLGVGLDFGGMHSQGMAGAYLDATFGTSRIDADISEESSGGSYSYFETDVPTPYLNRVALTYGRTVFDKGISISLAAGPVYTFGVRNGKYLYSTTTDPFLGIPWTSYFESIPINELGLTAGAMLDLPLGRHFDLGFRTSLTVDRAESYGLFAMTIGYVFR